MSKKVQVAIALILNQGKVLVGWRDEHLHQGGCYEFPGGKIEVDESVQQALQREVMEEVGIEIDVNRQFAHFSFAYADKTVELYFYRCIARTTILENQHWQWIGLDQVLTLPFPAANLPVLRQLHWSRELAIAINDIHLTQCKTDLCYLREDLDAVRARLHQNDSLRYIVNIEVYQQLSIEMQQQIFAIHLKSSQLHQTYNEKLLQNKNLIAACHHVQDIAQAEKLGCDAILLSPIQATLTHPDHAPIGWQKFSVLAQSTYLPVYALGGIQRQQLDDAIRYGAYGVAGIGDFWNK
ncbi:NUDIX domain-containing protein [Acinetobacter qingfengensis]|uniref:8-oxo-dGTP diphosphatase n=1 Tax=Acinetobacter qingfengensis TaxID=1262585 RepID=A0A1E7REA6_9GAMM|nr:thiamine phosphate synthase [Acinetobacter qingfengensis]KAA8734753.1 NUDIX domain-containing protein [Acinetobacter qingfengensis]OEY97671.1 hypothetical protein BJI46_08645 [Acinetobacter qingfengensis]